MHDERLYRHSGHFSVTGLGIGFVATSVVGVALAFIYAYALIYIPFIYINVLLTLGFGIALGIVAAGFISRFKIRNTRQAFIMTFLAVAVSYYFAWVFWMIAHLHSVLPDASAWALAQHPGSVWQLVLAFNEGGTWSLGRHSTTPVTGIFLTIVWIIEAGMIFGAAIMAILGGLELPFCEQCQNWCKERKGIASVSAQTLDSLRERIMEKDWGSLEEAGPDKPHLGTWCALNLCACPSCGQTNTLTLNLLTMTHNKKGEPKTATKTVINRLLLTQSESQALLETCDRLNVQPAETEASMIQADANPASNATSETP